VAVKLIEERLVKLEAPVGVSAWSGRPVDDCTSPSVRECLLCPFAASLGAMACNIRERATAADELLRQGLAVIGHR